MFLAFLLLAGGDVQPAQSLAQMLSGGMIVRVIQCILAMTVPIWHDDHTGQAIRRSLTTYDH